MQNFATKNFALHFEKGESKNGQVSLDFLMSTGSLTRLIILRNIFLYFGIS